MMSKKETSNTVFLKAQKSLMRLLSVKTQKMKMMSFFNLVRSNSNLKNILMQLSLMLATFVRLK